MPGRPRTKHRKIKAIREQLKSLEAQLLRLLPPQYHTDGVSQYLRYTPSPDDQNFDSKGLAWRAAVRGLLTVTWYVTWLEALINPDPPPDPLDDDEELDGLNGQADAQGDTEADGAAQAADEKLGEPIAGETAPS